MTMGRYSYYEPRDFSTKLASKYNTIAINKEVLRDLLTIQAGSGAEQPVISYIVNYIQSNKINCRYTMDSNGNMYITKGMASIYPCIVAHMDEVCADSGKRIVVELNNVFIGINPNTGEHAGCPGDDRVGVYCALEMLRLLPECKICFFVQEEIGARNGSQTAPLTFFKDCAFILQADRAGDDEFIVASNGGNICGKDFISSLSQLAVDYGYYFSEGGTFTDCGVLSSRGVGISCINFGAAYFDNHSMDEKVCITGVENVMNIIYRVSTEHANKRWTNKHESYSWKYNNSNSGYTRGGGFNLSNRYSQYDDYDDYSDWKDVTDKRATERLRKELDEFDFKYMDSIGSAHEGELPCDTCKTFDCLNCKLV